MDKTILVDTSILISMQRGNSETARQFSQAASHIKISRITAAELLFGSRNLREKKINKNFISQFDVLEIETEISLLAYQLIDQYSLKNGLGIADSLIAATALKNKHLLWTENQKHFKTIKDLKIYNPTFAQY